VRDLAKIESAHEKNAIFYIAVRKIGFNFFLNYIAVGVSGVQGPSLAIPGVNPTNAIPCEKS